MTAKETEICDETHDDLCKALEDARVAYTLLQQAEDKLRSVGYLTHESGPELEAKISEVAILVDTLECHLAEYDEAHG